MKVYQDAVKKNKALNFYLQNREGLLNLKGDSMYPSLQNGWKAKIAPAEAAEIRAGDIVVLSKENTFMCHRVIANGKFLGNYYFVQKGDNQQSGRILKADDLLGKVVEVFDGNGKRVDELEWRDSLSIKNVKVLCGIYLFLYLAKRCIWFDDTNMFTRFIERFYWRHIFRKVC